MILIITNKQDTHPTPVIKILVSRQIPFFRLNTDSLLTDYEFCWWCNKSSCDFRIMNKDTRTEIFGSQIGAIWERRPEPPSTLPIVSPRKEINDHNLKEGLGFLQFLRFYLKDIPSIGSITNDRTASSKLLQYKVALQLGLKVPDTCFSNKKEDIFKFTGESKSLAIKSIENDSVWLDGKDEEYVFYVQKVLKKDLLKQPEDAFSQTVNFLQKYIDKKYELRITVVGDSVFACKIESQTLTEETGKIDWRQGYDHGLSHSVYTLPPIIESKCLEFLKHMGLNFGCFDFIVTPKTNMCFLSVIPMGNGYGSRSRPA